MLFLSSTTFTMLFMKGIVFSRSYSASMRERITDHIPQHSSLLNSILLLVLLFWNGLSYSSGIQSVYFVSFMALVFSKAFLHIRLAHAISLIYAPLLIYNVLHIMITYLYQSIIFRDLVPKTLSETLGFRFYGSDITPVPLIGASIIVSWVSSILLLICMSFRLQNASLRSVTRIQRDYLTGSDGEDPPRRSTSTTSHRRSAYWDRLRPYIREWGWRLCVLSMLAIALFLPSFFSVILLIVVCVASVVPQLLLEKYYIIPGITLYLFAITIAQYIYNIPHIGIPCDAEGQTVLCALGLRTYEITWFQIGLQSLACLLLGINWSFYESGMDLRGVQLSGTDILHTAIFKLCNSTETNLFMM